ncbi:MAG: radical SAM protein [Nanoarchaeota archaeon]|nr:radical SAM protein [Nanoarchaeota archaeon]
MSQNKIEFNFFDESFLLYLKTSIDFDNIVKLNSQTFLVLKDFKKYIAKFIYGNQLKIDVDSVVNFIDAYNELNVNTPKIVEFKEENNFYFFLVEFIEGVSMKSNEKYDFINLSRVKLLAKSLADFHEPCLMMGEYGLQTIIHGDLNIGNILRSNSRYYFIDNVINLMKFSEKLYQDPALDVAKIILSLRESCFWKPSFENKFILEYINHLSVGVIYDAFFRKVISLIKESEMQLKNPKLLLSHASFQLTSDCNLNCKYCYQHEKSGKSMSFDEFTNAFSKLLGFLNKNVEFVFTGGEPLLNFDLLKEAVNSIKTVKELNPQFKILTNGLLLNSEIISFLKENEFLVAISIDGDKSNVFRICDELKLQLELENSVKLLVSSGCNYYARMTIHPTSAKFLYDDFKYLKSLGVKKFAIEPCLNSGIFWGEHSEDFLSNYRKIVENLALDFNTDSELFFRDLNFFDTKILESTNPAEEFYCANCSDTVFVSAEGGIYFAECGMGAYFKKKKYFIGDLLGGLDYDLINKSRSELIQKFQINDQEIYCGKPCLSCNVVTGEKLGDQEFLDLYKLNQKRYAVARDVYEKIKV